MSDVALVGAVPGQEPSTSPTPAAFVRSEVIGFALLEHRTREFEVLNAWLGS